LEFSSVPNKIVDNIFQGNCSTSLCNAFSSNFIVLKRSAITSGSALYTSVEPPSPAEEPSTSLLLENYVQPQVNKTCSNSFNIQRTNISISSILLEGTFGSVFQGTMRITAIESPFQEIFTDITIKTVKGDLD
jgi:hypothetical protein